MNHSELSHRGFSTRCVHAGTYLDPVTGGACTPIFSSTAHRFPHPTGRNIYPRYFNTPNQQVVARKVAALEGAEEGLVFASGMAAITTLLAAHLRSGDHAVFQADLYGGTWELVTRQLPRWGISFSLARTEAEIQNACRPETRLIYVESPSNPLLRCLDLAAVAAFARSRGIPTAIDNTFATPFNQNPIALGFDLVVHSATKYLNGHSDVVAGVVVTAREDEFWAELCRIRHDEGAILGPFEAWLLLRGLRTLAVRLARQCASALQLAAALEGHPALARVLYPGLASHKGHTIAARQMQGGFGGMLSIVVRGGAEAAIAAAAAVRIWKRATSLGGVESLIEHRASIEGEDSPAPPGLLRLSVGLEDWRDLLADLEGALARTG